MRQRKIVTLAGLGALGIAAPLVLSAVTTGHTPSNFGSPQGPDSLVDPGSYEIQLSGYVVPMSPEALVYGADVGFSGQIVALSDARWSTPSGLAPDAWEPGKPLPQAEVIYRMATIRVTEKLYGEVDQEVTLSIVGGSFGGVTMTPEDRTMPEVSIGDDVVVFAYEPPAEWRLGKGSFGLVQG